MSANSLPPVDQLRQLFIYEPDTGRLIWRKRPREMFKTEQACKTWNAHYAGKAAGTVHTRPSGYQYMQVTINDRKWKAHRLAYALYYGHEPERDIDHLDRNPLNNRICNLREASDAHNAQNQVEPQKGNTSGYRGVYWYGRDKKWCAQIKVNGKQKHLGYYATPEQAHAAYMAAKAKYHAGAVIA